VNAILIALVLAATVGSPPTSTGSEEGTDPAGLLAERAATIQRLLQSFSFAESEEHQIQVIRALGALRATEAAGPLVARLVRLHRETPSPYRDPQSPGHAVAAALVDALRQIGRPALSPFLEALATWDRYALDLTWSYVAVHGEEGILVLGSRARLETDPERRSRLEAALWFTQLRSPEVKQGAAPALPEPPLSTPRTR
jgi:hypothetical protein